MTVENDRKIKGMNDFRAIWMFYIPASWIVGWMLRRSAILPCCRTRWQGAAAGARGCVRSWRVSYAERRRR